MPSRNCRRTALGVTRAVPERRRRPSGLLASAPLGTAYNAAHANLPGEGGQSVVSASNVRRERKLWRTPPPAPPRGGAERFRGEGFARPGPHRHALPASVALRTRMARTVGRPSPGAPSLVPNQWNLRNERADRCTVRPEDPLVVLHPKDRTTRECHGLHKGNLKSHMSATRQLCLRGYRPVRGAPLGKSLPSS